MRNILIALAAATALVPAGAAAQTPVVAPAIAGTRLDISATGEVSRIPDVAIISAGVVTRAATATAAIQDTANRMERIRAALKRAGIADRDIRNSGEILDALVAQGANQINGPTLTIDKPEAALDEARAKALSVGRARADLYARSLGMRVVRLVSVSESGGYSAPPPMPYARAAMAADASTKIEPGEQQLQVTLAMSFELQ
jgi:uncharacterized protein YggE